MRKIAFMIQVLAAFFLTSCMKELWSADSDDLAGKWAQVDETEGTTVTDRYVEFAHGFMMEYKSDERRIVEAGSIWDCEESQFTRKSSHSYSVRDNSLYFGMTRQGHIDVDNGEMYLSGKKYVSFKSFSSECYRTIIVGTTSVAASYEMTSVSIPCKVFKLKDLSALKVTTPAAWILNMKVDSESLNFYVAPSTSRRETDITLSCFGARDVVVHVVQTADRMITLGERSKKVNYQAQTVNWAYGIINPRQGAVMTATTSASWITAMTVAQGSFSFQTQINNTGSERSADIVLSYPGADPVTVKVTQTYDAPVLAINPSSVSVSSSGGSQTLSYTVTNPRTGTKFSIAGDVTWISNFKLTSSTITFDVAANNSSKLRSGKITVKYGTYASREVSVSQSGASVSALSVSPTSLALVVGDKQKLTVSVTPSDATLLWSSSASSVASVGTDGTLSAISAGTATITVRAGSKSATCTVKVTERPTFALSTSSLAFDVNKLNPLTFNIVSNSDCTFKVSSDNPGVAGVSLSGKTVTVTPYAMGKAVVSVECPATERYESGGTLTCEVVVTTVSDLSAGGTANCYIAGAAGLYKFKATRGNSSSGISGVASVDVLWESYGDMVQPVVGSIVANPSYSDGYVMFEARNTAGNAVIAARSSAGRILWSWHIWCTPGNLPKDQVYYNGAGTLMDRNLGALSATPGDIHALGLLYQWGRKDPFLSGGTFASGSTLAASTITWPSATLCTSTTGTIDYAVEHPTTFIYADGNSSARDWCYTRQFILVTDNTRWQPSGSSKTIYDPCPAGYRVPDGDVFYKAMGVNDYVSYDSSHWDSVGKGVDFAHSEHPMGSADCIWYPAAGYYYFSNAMFYGTGSYANYWTASSYDYRTYHFSFTYYPQDERTYVRPHWNEGGYKSYGFSVRCARE